jgi:flagellar hook-associated protein 1 FlgK
MSGLFQGLDIGKRALLTHQLSMMVVGHNISNVNTPGYTRQRTLIASGLPIEFPQYNLGTGVTAKNIKHIRDAFLTSQYRRENKSLGEWEFKDKALSQIETVFSEPHDESLGDVMNQFWTSWLDLSNNPESMAARSAVVVQSETLINTFHSLDTRLRSLRNTADADVVARVTEINQYSKQIANLNRLIVGEELTGQSANDLRDQRDHLIDKLSNLVDVTVMDNVGGSVTVYVSGLAIVEKADTFDLSTVVDTSSAQLKHDLVWKNTKTKIKVTGGQLKGLLETRDIIVPKYMDQIDQLASAIVNEVNQVHRNGTGLNGISGLNFFNGSFTTAGSIRMEQGIKNDPSNVAASISGEPGDNANALAISDLRTKMSMSFGTISISDFYNAMIGTVGVEAFEAKTFKGNFEVLLMQIENSRQSIQGVSLDEEMADMVKLQHAYNAAARIITAMDEALGTLIQGMGVVGR